MRHDRHTVEVSETHVVIRRTGSSIPTVAKILGREVDPDGSTHLWLDRLVHRGKTQTLNDQWVASGAISSILVGR